MPSLDTTRLETFVLARLLVRPKSGLGLADVRKQLYPFVSHVLSESDWRARLQEVVARLRQANWVVASELKLTPEGEAEVLDRLSLDRPPATPNWPVFMAEAVVPAALGFKPADVQLKTADDLVALLLVREFKLELSGPATLSRALNALVWQALGVRSDERLVGGALQRAVLQRHLDGTRIKEPDRLARILAAKVSGARSAGANPARQSVLRDWLLDDSRRRNQDRSGSADGLQIESFAEAARQAARDPETIRFGEHKAFIDSVFERYRTGSVGPDMELPMFKKKLVAAHRKGLLTLARADLVEAMDPERVAASETHYLNTTFHFVEAD